MLNQVLIKVISIMTIATATIPAAVAQEADRFEPVKAPHVQILVQEAMAAHGN